MSRNTLSYLDDDEDSIGSGYDPTIVLPEVQITGHPAAPDMSEDEFPDRPEQPHAGALSMEDFTSPDGPMPSSPSRPSTAGGPISALGQSIYDKRRAAMHPELPQGNGDPEQTAVTRGGGGSSGGGGGVSPWAYIADLALNHGRGMGQIAALSAAQENEAPDKALERQYKLAQIQHLQQGSQGRAVDPEVMELRRRALDLRAAGQGQQTAAQAARATAAEAKATQGTNDADAMRTFFANKGVDVSDLGGVSVQTLAKLHPELSSEYKMANAPRLNEAAGSRARAVSSEGTDARLDQVEAHAPITRDNKVAEQTALLPGKQTLKASPGAASSPQLDDEGNPKLTVNQQLAKDRFEEQKRARLLAEKVRDDGVFDRDSKSFTTGSDAELTTASNVKDLRKLLERHPNGMPSAGTKGAIAQWGKGLMDKTGTLPESMRNDYQDSADFDRLRANIGRFDIKSISGAAFSDKEKLASDIQTGAQPGASMAQITSAVNAIDKVNRMKLKAKAVGNRAARSVLGAAGLDDILDPEGAPTETPLPAAAPQSMLPGKGGSSLSGVRVQKPDGTIGRVNGDRAEVAAMAAKRGWKVLD